VSLLYECDTSGANIVVLKSSLGLIVQHDIERSASKRAFVTWELIWLWQKYPPNQTIRISPLFKTRGGK